MGWRGIYWGYAGWSGWCRGGRNRFVTGGGNTCVMVGKVLILLGFVVDVKGLLGVWVKFRSCVKLLALGGIIWTRYHSTGMQT